MSISKTAAYERAKSEIARYGSNTETQYTISLYNHEKENWVELGKICAKKAREFEKRYIEHRVQVLLSSQ